MKRLPTRPNLGHLKRQAKDLLFAYKAGDAAALTRFRNSLPFAIRKDDEALLTAGLRLHDAQSCVAREYGFESWADLSVFVQARSGADDRGARIRNWLRLVYAGDIAGGNSAPRPLVAARILADEPGLLGDDPYLACAIGDEARLRSAVDGDPGWVNLPGGPLELSPLLAVTHSSMLRLPDFRNRLVACAKFLLKVGANPNQAVGSRWNTNSVAQASGTYPLSALYGASGQNHDPKLTSILLEAGADPNDGESLYHSLESPDCTRLLLEAGARPSDAYAIYRALDLDDIDVLRLLLSYGADPNEAPKGPPTSHWGSPLLWAIRRRRSPAHITALLEAGADTSVRSSDGTDAYTLALRFGLPDVAKLLPQDKQSSSEEQFIAACSRADESTARQIQLRHPALPKALSATQLRLLPELAALGCGEAVKVMVNLGWPIAIRGGDWDASALNHAIFRGDATLTRFLLEHGANWTEQHGFGDNAAGTLSWASCNEPVEHGDWLGCAVALVEHGMSRASRDPEGGGAVIMNGEQKRFSDEVTEFLLGGRTQETEISTS